MFAPTKNSFFEVSDDVIACDLWFAPPNQKSWLRQWQISTVIDDAAKFMSELDYQTAQQYVL